jgi:hypothetical protein
MRHREAFQTEAEALAFIQGVEYVDNDHVTTEGPSPEIYKDRFTDGVEFVVYVEVFS